MHWGVAARNHGACFKSKRPHTKATLSSAAHLRIHGITSHALKHATLCLKHRSAQNIKPKRIRIPRSANADRQITSQATHCTQSLHAASQQSIIRKLDERCFARKSYLPYICDRCSEKNANANVTVNKNLSKLRSMIHLHKQRQIVHVFL